MSILSLLLAGVAGFAPSPPQGLSDINRFCELVPAYYAYYEPRSVYWNEACDQARDDLAAGEGRLAVLEGLVDALYDPHANLGANNAASPRLVPSGLDIRLTLLPDSKARIVGIRPGTTAARSGLHLGDEVVAIHGLPPLDAARQRIHVGPEDLPGRLDWALNAAMAGYRDEPRSITILRDDKEIQHDLGSPEPEAAGGLVTARSVADGITYIRFENSLDQDETVAEFMAALDAARQADGLILDLRNTPGGGNTSVAEPILGAFLAERQAYQMTVPKGGVPEPRFAGPAEDGQPFKAPVIVLVGYWTGSMGEGLAIGFDGTGAGTVIGSRMARLAGGTEGFGLPESGISLWLPTYDLTHVDGTPRHEWAPFSGIPADFGDGEDLLLGEAISLLTE